MEGRSCSCFYKSRLCYKMILQVLLLLGFVGFLLVGVVDTRRTTSSKVMMGRLNPQQVMGFHQPEAMITAQRHSNKDRKRFERLKFVSKRRVPNGPDPIHNRRAGNSNQPPGRSQRAGEAEIKGRGQ